MKSSTPILIIMVVSFGFGLLNVALTGHYRSPNPWHLMEQLSVITLIYWWYYCDKTERHYTADKWMNISMVVLPVIVIPIYLFRSRGAKGGAIATVLFAVTILGVFFSLVFGAVVAKYVFH